MSNTMISHEDWFERFKPLSDDDGSPIDHVKYSPNSTGAGSVDHVWTLIDIEESTDHIPAKYKDDDGEVKCWDTWQDDPNYEAGVSCVIVSGNHIVNRLETYVCEVAITDSTQYQVED